MLSIELCNFVYVMNSNYGLEMISQIAAIVSLQAWAQVLIVWHLSAPFFYFIDNLQSSTYKS